MLNSGSPGPFAGYHQRVRTRDLGLLLGVAGMGAGALMYAHGYRFGRRDLTLDRVRLDLPLWPADRDGFSIAVLADFHVKDAESADFALKAIAMAMAENPDVIVLPGDLVQSWNPTIPRLIGDVLLPLREMKGSVVAVPGNHDYKYGPPDPLEEICAVVGITLLRNQSWRHKGIRWVGVDSYCAGVSDGHRAMAATPDDDPAEPTIVLWHEPDTVDILPTGAALQISGHSHGGQFILPGGITPKRTYMGRKYYSGFYPNAPTPLYVSRGIGTTFLPSRFQCPPEVSLLTLYHRPDGDC